MNPNDPDIESRDFCNFFKLMGLHKPYYVKIPPSILKNLNRSEYIMEKYKNNESKKREEELKFLIKNEVFCIIS